ncbi:MAG TPA: phenylalanine--tRNA ligase subunit beta [Candidatus Saccharimonadales bacterium]|nr:phenylalanine--tRNA ligase subunit beta [Candidatus Saccharimonadales bacterium]
MKVSLNWIRQLNKNYGTSDSSELKDVDKLVEKIGEQLGAVEEVIDLGERYKGVVVVKVIECVKHPDADKLSVCLVDDGGVVEGVERADWPQDTRASAVSARERAAEEAVGKATVTEQRSSPTENVPQPGGVTGSASKQGGRSRGLVRVVCGAPNVKAGVTVAWIPPGATVPSTFDKDPFVLEARPLRGIVSNGMLASAKELGIGDSHEGLLLLEDKKPGTSFAEAYALDDFVIDIENKMFTHRPDCFGILGVARELAGISGKPFKSPDWYKENARPEEGFGLELKVENKVPELVPRFTAIALKDVKVGPSPVWMQSCLSRVGIRPINNVVDLTNYYMYLTGQPLHAYDYDKVKTGILGVRLSKKSEKVALLNGKTLELNDGAVVITDGQKPIGIGGVMGGAETEVDANTKNIILECATFDMNLTRKTAMAYGLFTDAVTRFTKGQSPLQNLAVLTKTVDDLERFSGAAVASALIDEKSPKVKEPKPLTTSVKLINSRLGEELSGAKIKELLENVEFKVDVAGDEVGIDVPFWRTDIEIPEDIVEEVGRLYGYDKLPQILPKRNLEPAQIDHRLAFKSHLRKIMVAAGANEVLTYSFVNQKLLEAADQDPASAFHIRNAVSPELQYYRFDLLPSLLDKVRPNKKAGYDLFALFELGKGHAKDYADENKLPKESEMIAMVVHNPYLKGEPIYQARAIADYLLNELNIDSREYYSLGAKDLENSKIFKFFEPGRSATIWSGGTGLGIIGEPSQKLRRVLKLPAGVSMFELNIEALYETQKPKSYHPLNKFPESSQDICLRLPAKISYEEADDFVWENLQKLSKKQGYLCQMDTLDIFQKEGDKTHRQITWHISLSHPEKTLKTEEVNNLLDELSSAAHDKLGAERI